MVKSIVSAEPGRTDRGIGIEEVDVQVGGVVVWRTVWRRLCGVVLGGPGQPSPPLLSSTTTVLASTYRILL